MAKIDYRTVNRRKVDKYIYPEEDETRLSDVLIPAAEMGLFFTRPGHAITGAVFGAAQRGAFAMGRFGMLRGAAVHKWAAGGGAKRAADFLTMTLPERAAPLVGRVAGGVKAGAPGAATAVGGAAKRVGSRLMGEGFAYGKIASNVGRFIQKRPGVLGAAAVGAGLLFGGMKAMRKQPVTLQEDIGRGGPDVNKYLKTKGGRLRPGHLGATGDLTLSLHQGR